MIKLTSIQQAISMKGTIPELANIRAIQFMGDGYSPDEHGHIIVIQEGDEITQIKEIGEDADAIFGYEFIEAFIDDGGLVFEVVFQLDDSRTVALIIPDEPWLDPILRNHFLTASPPPMPLPQLKEVMESTTMVTA